MRLISVSNHNYLRQESCVFIGISLLVNRTAQEPLKQFSQNSVEMWHTGHGRNSGGNPDHVRVRVTDTVRCRLSDTSDSGLVGVEPSPAP